MRFSELEKGRTYVRFDQIFLFLEDRETFVLARFQIEALSPKRCVISRLKHNGKPGSREFIRVTDPATQLNLHATVAGARAFLVNTIRRQLSSAEHRVKRLTQDLNAALLLEVP